MAHWLDSLEAQHRAATPAPWYPRLLNDDLCMTGFGVSISPDPVEETGFVPPIWPEAELIAACLIQEPPLVLPMDQRSEENAQLIAAMRNALPELLRLSRIGLAASVVASGGSDQA